MTTTTTDSPTTAAPSAESAEEVNHAFFMLVRTSTEWLALEPDTRFQFLGEAIAPILERHPAVSMRFFDSEAFHADYSDVVLWETRHLLEYQAIVEELRETPFWGHYFQVVSIVPAIENAYARQYQVTPL